MYYDSKYQHILSYISIKNKNKNIKNNPCMIHVYFKIYKKK